MNFNLLSIEILTKGYCFVGLSNKFIIYISDFKRTYGSLLVVIYAFICLAEYKNIDKEEGCQ